MHPRIRFLFLLLFAAWVFPATAAAQWFGSTDGLCSDASETDDLWASLSVVEDVDASGGCTDDSLADPSSNACFEGAEYPISVLPHVIAETAAERVTAGLVLTASELVRPVPPLPSPDEASVEDPHIPGVPLVKAHVPRPRPIPNACSVDPAECEATPWVPTVELEVSQSFGERIEATMEIERRLDVESRRGPPNLGVGDAAGVTSRVERPPELA